MPDTAHQPAHHALHATPDAAPHQRVVLEAFGGPDGFTLREEEAPPEPGPGEVRIRVEAASVQFTDVIIRKGEYIDLKAKPPLVPGYDCVGRVEAVGPGVTQLSVGDRVADMTMIGSYATHRLLDATRCVPVPEGVDAAEAVSLVLSWMTAYQLLHRHAKVQAGQTVLIHGAAGAVGQALLRLGQLHGLEMFGTCRAEHADLVASFGATPIDYREEDFTEVLADGVDVVFDGIGEEGFARSWRVVKRGGTLAAFGFSAGIQAGAPFAKIGYWFLRLFFWNLWPNGKRAAFYAITDMRKAHPDWFREDLSTLLSMLEEGTLEPRIEARIGLGDVAEAHRRLEAGGLDGKLVIVPG
ncbi:MAG: oxidoreductase [Sandaracinaceae bacterium]|nr:MAG: oxidoreductase [Sandaracinaceae bacterium]